MNVAAQRAFRMFLLAVTALVAACSGDSAQGPGSGAGEAVASKSAKLGGACTALTGSVTSDHPIQANWWTSAKGSNITVTPTPTGCSPFEYIVYHQPPDGSWKQLVGPSYSQAPSFTWNTANELVGTHNFYVRVRSVGATVEYEAYWNFAYVLLASPTCTSLNPTTLPIPSGTAENFAMAAVGTDVTINTTATGCATPQFRITYMPPDNSGWVEEAPWSATDSNASHVWHTAGKAPGTYSFLVMSRAQGSSAEYEWYTGFSYKLLPTPICTLANTSYSPYHVRAPNQWIGSVGTQVTLASTATCTASEYKIYHQRPNSTQWIVERDYPTTTPTDDASRNATFVWNTTSEPPGIHQWQIWARGQGHGAYGVGYESYNWIGYTLLPSPMCDSTPMTSVPSGHAPVGSLVALKGNATVCPQPSHRYVFATPSSVWRELQAWTPSPVAHWNTLLEAPGTYSLQTWLRNADSTAQFDTYNYGTYTLDAVTPTHSVSVSGGTAHNCALLANGQVGCWGSNAHGELGNGTTMASSSSAVAVAGVTQGISLGVGSAHACAALHGGTVVCWGNNDHGQTGNSLVAAQAIAPVGVTGIASASTVGVGAAHSCAALADGSVKCWGANNAGQLGDGTLTDRVAPVTVANLPNDATTQGAIQVVGGLSHTCALLGDGTVRCWGSNDKGQLGNGGSSSSLSPVVVSNLTGVSSLSARNNATCAVKSDGHVWCWGDPGLYGVLGNGTISPNYQRLPVEVSNITNARNVAVGTEHACASLQDNSAVCWGRNTAGQLGNGTNTSSLTPVVVSSGGLGAAVASVGVSDTSSCALLEGHWTTCWGNGSNGERGNGSTVGSTAPDGNRVSAVPTWAPCTTVNSVVTPASAAVGDSLTFTSTTTGCSSSEYEIYRQMPDQSWQRISPAYSYLNSPWSWNSTGATSGWQQFLTLARTPGSTDTYQAYKYFDYYLQSPDACNSITITPNPATHVGVVGAQVTFNNTSTGCIGTPEYTIQHHRPDGSWHADAPYSAANSSWVWDTSQEVSGWNTFEVMVKSQNSTRVQEEVKYYDYYLQPGAPRVGGGFWQFCQLKGAGNIGCWGLNSHGELGGGITDFHSATPVAVQGINYATSLGVGWGHACATILGGGVKCWGQNQWAQLGNGTQTDSNVPVSVAGITTATHVAAGTAHSCAALADGTAKCWGLNTTGQLGSGASNAFSAPVSVANLTNVKRVSAGYYHSCALLADGTVRCWGLNDKGQLGNGNNTQSLSPVQVSGLTGVTQLATYAYQNCAVKSDHTIWCWGANSPNGTLGDGTTASRAAPVRVANIDNAVHVAVTGYHACAALQDGTVKCWGLNDHGQLGNNSTTSSLAPVAVTGITNAAYVAVNENSSCAGKFDGNVSCWGWGLEGNLGNGSYGSSSTPVTVGNVPPPGSGTGGGTACSNGVRDGNESDVDCGGSCSPCDKGDGCNAAADCASGLVCGTGNGACFNGLRSKGVCWAASCADGISPDECGSADSPCGPNCACVTGCNSDTASLCPSGETCVTGAGQVFAATTRDVCLDARCPSNDPALCGEKFSVCGPCVCTPNCTQATCANPSDGCGGECTGVCTVGQSGCTSDAHCGAGNACLLNPDGSRSCRPQQCANQALVPPLCGTPGAVCGDTCPACTPACDGRQCGADPACGTSCGTCSEGSYCDASGLCVSPLADELPTVPGAEGQPPISIPPLPQVAASAVGAVRGGFSVSEFGTPIYSVPIEVPPGRAGLEPGLSLVYSGSRANGDLGIGWSLEGLSKITRCPRTFALDGYAAPIRNSPADALCMDGKRLIQVQSSLGLTEYRTAIDSFSRIEAHQDAGNGVQLSFMDVIGRVQRAFQGPDWFKVSTKDGRILTYGGTADSIVMARTGVRNTWLLREVRDRAGNTIVVNYDNRQGYMLAEATLGIVRPSRIAYTGSGATVGDREVRFTYETRSDQQVRFFQGAVATVLNERLSRVSTFVHNRPVKNYRLHYSEQNRSQIDRIYECEGDADTRCKKPTIFEYKSESGFSQGVSSVDVKSAVQLDLDGNGIPDFFETVTTIGGVPAHPEYKAVEIGADIAVGLAAGAMTFGTGLAVTAGYTLVKFAAIGLLADRPEVKYTNNVYLGTGNRQIPTATTVNNVQGVPCQSGTPLAFLDYDRDGKDDVLGTCDFGLGGQKGIFLARSIGNGHFQRVPNATEPLLLLPPFNDGSLSGNATGRTPAPIWIDLNGDSLHDLISCTDKLAFQVRMRLGANEGFAAPIDVLDEHHALCFAPVPTTLPIDIDGDGIIDLAARGTDQWQVLRYHGGATPSVSWEPVDFKDWEQSVFGRGLMFVDLNSDGLMDVWSSDFTYLDRQKRGQRTAVWLNKGGSKFAFQELPVAANFPANPTRYAAVDYDANGLPDILHNVEIKPDLETVTGWENHVLTPTQTFGGYTLKVPPDFMVQLVGHPPEQSPMSLVTDIDGDGNPDVYGDKGAVLFGSGVHNKLLSRVVDGLGNYVSVRYDGDGSNNPSWYVEDCVGSTWPVTCVKRMNSLVTMQTEGVLDANNVEVTERTYDYTYRNAKMDTAGHGWLGFESRKVTQSFTGGKQVKVATLFESPTRTTLGGAPKTAAESVKPPYVYPFAGLVHSVTVEESATNGLTGAAPLEEGQRGFIRRTRTENHWETHASADLVMNSQDHLTFPWLSSRSTTVYEGERPEIVIGGPPVDPGDGAVLFACAETSGVDSYGNITSSLKQCVDKNGNSMSSDAVTRVVFPNSTLWLIANPESETVTSHRNQNQYSRKTSFTYEPIGLLKSVTRGEPSKPSSWHKSTFIRNDYGNVTDVIEEVMTGEPSRTNHVDYDEDQVFPLKVTNALGHPTQVRFDERWGAVTTVVDANNVVSSSAYDGLGLVSQTVDPSGTTAYTYTAIAPENQSISTSVGLIRPRTRLVKTKQAGDGTRDATATIDTDYLGRVVRTQSDGFGGTAVLQERTYDATGRLVAATLPHTTLTDVPSVQYTYDGFDRVVRRQRSDGTFVQRQYATVATLKSSYQHWLTNLDCEAVGEDIHGCAIGIERTIDETGRENVIVSDHFGMPLRNVDGENIATAAHVSDYVYGGFNVLQSIYSSVDSHFEYDDYGRRLLEQEQSYATKSEASYNGYDEVKTTEDAKHQVRSYEYDGLGRLKLIVDPGEALTQWIYDEGQNATGRLSRSISPATAESPNGQIVEYTYEPYVPSANRGALKTAKYIIDGTTYPIEFTYDALARPKRTTYPNVGVTTPPGAPVVVENKYDPVSGELTGLDEVGSSATRQLWRLNEAYQGQLLQKETFENGAISTYSYDAHTRFLNSIKTTLPSAGAPSVVTTIQDLNYTKYDNGRVHTRKDQRDLANIVQRDYTYDVLNRLSSAVTNVNGAAGTPESYGYDAYGNLAQHGSLTNSYVADVSHKYRLQNVGSNTYQYDANGNVENRTGPDIPGGEQTIEYTPFDLPRTITTGAAGTIQTAFDYDADEARVVRRDSAGTRYFIGSLYQRATDSQNATIEERFRIYAGGRNIGEIVRRPGVADQTLFFHTDHLDSVDTISTNLREVNYEAFEPFGANAGTSLSRAGFTGHQNDTDLGLIDMGGRVYDPLAGRFLTEDPVVQAPFWSQGLNPYSYVFNDPINHTDPSGFSADVDFGGGLVGGLVGAGHLAGIGLATYQFGGGAIAGGGQTALAGLAGGMDFAGLNLALSAFMPNPGAGSAERSFAGRGGERALTSLPGGTGGSGATKLVPEVFKSDWGTNAPALAKGIGGIDPSNPGATIKFNLGADGLPVGAPDFSPGTPSALPDRPVPEHTLTPDTAPPWTDAPLPSKNAENYQNALKGAGKELFRRNQKALEKAASREAQRIVRGLKRDLVSLRRDLARVDWWMVIWTTGLVANTTYHTYKIVTAPKD